MPIEIIVPRLGWSMEEGTFVEWLKQHGQHVRAGEMLFVLESEKAAQEVESFDSGILHIPPDAPQPGATVAVGQLLAYLLAEGELPPSAGASASTTAPHAIQHDKAPVARAGPITTPPTLASRVRISPRARRAARGLNVDWTTVRGTGRSGRIRERDVLAAAPRPIGQPTSAAGRSVPITAMRRTLAERMLAGVHQAAPVTLTTKADASSLVLLRERLAHVLPSRPSYTDLFIKLTADTLQQHPLLTSQWRGETIFIPDELHIAFAVETDAGLLAPVIRQVPEKSLGQVTAEARELIELARRGRLSAEQFHGAVFTITNLGAFGIDAFTPIINVPQTAILGIGRIVREPAVVADQVVPRDMLTLSLTFDHRVLDGAPAARFFDTLRRAVEDPGARLQV